MADETRITVREAVIDLLRAFGLTRVFGNPGSTELPMFRDFPQDFSYVLGLQESVVVGMADGYAQATGNAALVNLHSAAGVGHAMGNIFTAFKNQTPLVITAGQQARSMLPYDPFLFSADATTLPRPYVKWACEPARAEDVPAAIARAYHMAMQAPRGPVFVSIPVDDWDRPCTPMTTARTVSRTVNPDPAMLAEVAEALSLAERPVLVAGAQVALNDGWDALIALAERHEAPVRVAPFAARNVFPEDHRLFAGFLAANRAAIVKDLAGHDLILALGAPVFVYHSEGEGPVIPEGSRLIQIVDDPAMAAWAATGTSVVGDVRAALEGLLAGPHPRPRAAPQPLTRPAPLSGDRLTDEYLLQRISALRPKGSIIVEEAPTCRGPMHDHLPIVERDTFYTCASGGLGHGLPAAVGVALGRPDDRVIAVLGDGSTMYSVQGLWSAAQLGLPITFVIVNNGRYRALEDFGQLFGLQKLEGTQLPDIDFVGIAKGQGVDAVQVTETAALDEALRAAFSANRPTLVEVVVD